MRGDSGVAGEGRVVGACTKVSFMEYVHHTINKYQLRLDVQHFLWLVYCIGYILYYITVLTQTYIPVFAD